MESPPLRSNGDTPNHHPHHNHHHHHTAAADPLASTLRMALYDYDAQGEDELTLRKGQIVEVLSEDAKISGDEGWWTGKIGDKVNDQFFKILFEIMTTIHGKTSNRS